jgi:uncharacterized membrane protein
MKRASQPSPPPTQTAVFGTYNQVAGRSLERLAALSDGLFAFAMTLLVLDLRVPELGAVHSERDLLQALLGLSPRLLTWLMSFMTLSIFWTGQQAQLAHFKESDRHLSWIQLAFLSLVSLLPFSTRLLTAFVDLRSALLIYWLNLLALGVVIYASWAYACRHGLLKPEATPAVQAAVVRRILGAQSLYAVGAALCVFGTYWSIGFIVLVQLNFAVAPRLKWLSRL